MIPVETFRDQTVAVMGMARSGCAAAKALAAGGARVLAWDEDPERCAAAKRCGAEVRDLSRADLSGIAALILSPGIPHTHPSPHPVAVRAKAARVPIIGDIELLMRTEPRPRTIAVTGTNGKSTTTALIGHILRRAGRCCNVGGNIGLPVLAFADGRPLQVLELSSYQLELTPSLACSVAVLLNISPDHLERHGGMEGYVAAKRRILTAVPPGGTVVIGVQDAVCRGLFREISAQTGRTVVPISGRDVPDGGIGMQDRVLTAAFAGARRVLADLSGARALPGAHNAQNACAAAAAALAVGVDDAVIAPALADFPGLPHRQERVGVRNGVAFVNDSKATNADAASRALSCYATIYWIAGGLMKDDDLEALSAFFPRIRAAFLIGSSMDVLAGILGDRVPVRRCGTLEQAVAQADALARAEARDGAVVLLSPAAASFDQFVSYEHRGDRFRALVAGLGANGPENVR